MSRILLVVTLVALTTTLRGQAPPPAAADTTRLADEVFAATMERYPEVATFFGAPNARHDRVFDNTPQALRAWNQRIDGFAARLRGIEKSALAGRSESVTHGFLQHALTSEIERRVCQSEKWAVDQLFGWQISIPAYLERQPVATDADKRAALQRMRQYAAFVDQEIATLRQGLKETYSSPQGNVDRVIAQIQGLASGDPAASPFSAFAKNSDDEAFRRSVTEIVAKEINPALTRFRTFLGEYRSVARTDVGVSALPQGDACYRAVMRDYTSLPLTPDEVHQTGLSEMDKIHGEMRIIAQRSFGTSDLPALFERLRKDPAMRFATADAIRDTANGAIQRAKAAMGRYFGRLPKADVVLQPFADFEAAGNPPPQYRQPPLDGSKPGLYMVNLLAPTESSRVDAESTAFHEAIPGHHLQIALALEQTGAHPITQVFGSTAFIEGWALYAERLADEMGLYSSDLDRLGMLSWQAFRAARLVVDTGIHAKKWTRQQAIDYMVRNTATPETQIQSEVDRYIITPGQALAYMTGAREIRALREKAEAALGPRFDLRGFHDTVLGQGAVTLPTLREQVDRWIASQRN